MTEEEFVAKLAQIKTGAVGDEEMQHIEADKLVTEALRALGWTQAADAYEVASDDFWYA